MKITPSLWFAVVVVATATPTQGGQICSDGTPEPTSLTPTVLPATPAPTTPVVTTPAPPTPTPSTSTPTTPEPTTPAPTTPAPPTCGVIKQDTFFELSDRFRVDGAIDAPACCELCANTRACRAMGHVNSQKICYLYYYTGEYQTFRAPGASSSVMSAPQPTQPLLSNTHLVGHTYRTADSNTVEGCALQCSVAGTKCKGFTFGNVQCAFFDVVDGQATATGWTSALN